MKDYKAIKVGTFGMMNNPEYRQEPWKESVAQRLMCFDVVCFVCGYEPDIQMLANEFPKEWESGKLIAVYKPWPFPGWSYEELPKHLNAALQLARQQGCDWMVKLDIDTVFHEDDMRALRKVLWRANRKGKWVVSIPKLQFFTPTRYWKKGQLPLAINMTSPIVYGFDPVTYTDLCQPIEWDGVSMVQHNGKSYDIPSGTVISEKKVYKTGRTKMFNYDFTFRTYERSIELLYQIEMAHARFWGKGYFGVSPGEITRETSMRDYLTRSKDRFPRMRKKMKINQHPHYFQKALEQLSPGQWGFDLWGKL